MLRFKVADQLGAAKRPFQGNLLLDRHHQDAVVAGYEVDCVTGLHMKPFTKRLRDDDLSLWTDLRRHTDRYNHAEGGPLVC